MAKKKPTKPIDLSDAKWPEIDWSKVRWDHADIVSEKGRIARIDFKSKKTSNCSVEMKGGVMVINYPPKDPAVMG